MTRNRLIVVLFAVLALVAAGCGSDDDQNTSTWKFGGKTGSITVTGPTGSEKPRVEVTDPPFTVGETTVHVLTEGDGQVVPADATVSVQYLGVNGRDGQEFDSSYQRGTPADFPLTNVVPGFQKAIAGQKVGSTVAVAMTSADGYAEGNPDAGILKGDCLVFVIEILSVS